MKCKLTLYLQPGAKHTEISGKHGDYLKIRVKEPAIDGKANKALINFLSKKLKISKSAITLSSGEKNRIKTVTIDSQKSKSEIEAILDFFPNLE